MASGSSSIANTTTDNDTFEDACSICLESFTSDDPSTVTNCKHEYHLHCILEWSQRSKECPICWQFLALKDSSSQELLTAIDKEKKARRRNATTNVAAYPCLYPELDSEYVSQWTADPDFNEQIMQHLAAMMSQAQQAHVHERQGSHERRTYQDFVFSSRVSDSTMHPNTPEEWSSANGSSGGSSPTSSISSVDAHSVISPSPSFVNMSSISMPKSDPYSRSRSLENESQTSDSTQKQRSSELLAFSESIKSRLSATSARYKDSLSKGTQGIKEKFFARNIFVKELGNGVQREMNAGIVGVSRMMERLDLKIKRNTPSSEGRSPAGGTSNFFSKGKGLLDNIIANSCDNHVVADKEWGSPEKTQAACSLQSLKDV